MAIFEWWVELVGVSEPGQGQAATKWVLDKQRWEGVLQLVTFE